MAVAIILDFVKLLQFLYHLTDRHQNKIKYWDFHLEHLVSRKTVAIYVKIDQSSLNLVGILLL